MRILRIKPIEYYRLRGDTSYPSIISLEDRYGIDRRMAYPPFCETYLPSNIIVEYQDAIVRHISDGEQLVKIAVLIQETNNPFIKEKYMVEWQRVCDLSQSYSYGTKFTP